MKPSVSPPLPLSQLISPATVNLALQAGDRAGVLAELIGQVPELARKPEAGPALLRALETREQLSSTGLGHGVAIPHTRDPIASQAGRAVIVMGRHRPGLPWGAPDGEPVELFFLLIAPNISEHLKLLSRLTRLLRQEPLRQALLAADHPEQVVALLGEAEETLPL